MLDCYFKKYFLLECPGCGMQRAFSCLCHGEILNSLHFNAALIPLLSTFLILIFQLYVKSVNGGKWVVISFLITTLTMFIQLVFKLIVNYNLL